MEAWKYAVSAAPAAPKTAPILLTGDICDCLRQASGLGFDAIEYHTRENVDFDYDLVQKTMEEIGCKVSMIVTGRLFTEGGLSLTSNDVYKEKQALQGMMKYIDMASQLQAGLVLGWAKGRIRDAESRESYFEKLTDNLKILDQLAGEKKVPIVIEVINHYETDAFVTSRELVDYLQQNEFQNCYVHLDSFHMLLEEENYTVAIKTAGERLGYFHLADTTRWYPGSGYMDFREIFQVLDAIHYEGYMTIECFPHEDAYETARNGLQYLKRTEAFMRNAKNDI